MRRGRGFTLVEVAVTVVIIGILAVIAIVAYRRHIAASRVAEATNMMNAIRRGQEEHKAERGVYANVSQSLVSFYPSATPGKHVTQWGAPCTVCAGGDVNGWEKINVHADGPVIFGYATTAGIGSGGLGAPPAFAGAEGVEMTNAFNSQGSKVGATEPVFVALAEADANEDGTKCHVLGFSHSNHLVVTNEGE